VFNIAKNFFIFDLLTLWSFIDKKAKRSLKYYFLVILFSFFAEIISIGSVVPFLSAVISQKFTFSDHYPVLFNRFFNAKSDNEILLIFTITFGSMAIISSLIRLLMLWLGTKMAYMIGMDISSKVYNRILHQPYSSHISQNSSDVISIATTKIDHVVAIVSMSLNLISSIILIIAILIILTIINPLITLVTFFSFAFTYLLIIHFNKNIIKYHSKNVAIESSNTIKSLQEGLGSIRDIILDSNQNLHLKKFEKSNALLRASQGAISFISSFPRYALEGFGLFLISFIIYIAFISANNFNNILPVMGAIALGAQRLLPILQQTYFSFTGINGNRASLKDVLDYLNKPITSLNSNKIIFNESINLINISYSYPGERKLALKNFSIHIKKGEKVGIFGPSGGGKSTLLDILMGLLAPDSGEFLVDGASIGKESQNKWQKNIAHVPQSVYLTDSSIMENIAIGTPKKNIKIKLLVKVIKSSQLFETINKLPFGLNTIVGERGIQFSGGQRQRIGVARALYKEADVLLLDEATSALDNFTEDLLMKDLVKTCKKTTVIMVSHRLTSLKYCSKILEIKAGKVFKIWKYNDLMKASLIRDI
jgi:ABC-type multidrug transport system fused ATPase/permease subunit